MPRRGEGGGEREGGGRDGENRGIFERNKLNYFGALNFTYFNLPVQTESLLPRVSFRRTHRCALMNFFPAEISSLPAFSQF